MLSVYRQSSYCRPSSNLSIHQLSDRLDETVYNVTLYHFNEQFLILNVYCFSMHDNITQHNVGIAKCLKETESTRFLQFNDIHRLPALVCTALLLLMMITCKETNKMRIASVSNGGHSCARKPRQLLRNTKCATTAIDCLVNVPTNYRLFVRFHRQLRNIFTFLYTQARTITWAQS